MMNIINGERARQQSLTSRFMILPCGAPPFRAAPPTASIVHHTLKKRLPERGLSTSGGDEGGVAARIFGSNEARSSYLQPSRKPATGRDGCVSGLDVASSEFSRTPV